MAYIRTSCPYCSAPVDVDDESLRIVGITDPDVLLESSYCTCDSCKRFFHARFLYKRDRYGDLKEEIR